MRKERVGPDLGSVAIAPDAPARAGTPGHWDILYTCGARGLPAGAALRFEIPYGFTPPQTVYPAAVGYTTVSCTNGKAAVSLHLVDPADRSSANSGVWALYVFVTVDAGELRQGEQVTLHYGRDSRGEGACARYFEGLATFAVGVDPDGSRRAPHGGFLLPDTPAPALRVIGGAAAGLFAVAPSIVQPGEGWSVRATVRDRSDNNASAWDGTLEATDDTGRAIQADADPASSSRVELPGFSASQTGVTRITVTQAGASSDVTTWVS